MKSIVCTLFEHEYHYGVAALTNSLYTNGFRGSVYAGYRGDLPHWVTPAKEDALLGWSNARTLDVADGLKIHFLPLETDHHLTNYKPDFMLKLWSGVAIDGDAMFYFDPDIVLVAPWKYIEEWSGCGIAVCEDVKSPLEKYHPRRMEWRRYYKKYDIELSFKNSIYVNGGFIGVGRNNKDFLTKWQELQQHMSDAIGGLNRSSITIHTKLPDGISYEFSGFGATDQDALNATIEACDFEVSYMRQEAMAFKPGSPVLMPHALGSPKPWSYRPFKNFLNGIAPRYVDKLYWVFVDYPIQVYSKSTIRKMRFLVRFFAFLSRFYSKYN